LSDGDPRTLTREQLDRIDAFALLLKLGVPVLDAGAATAPLARLAPAIRRSTQA
jgi:hypothetical protein